MDLGLVSLEDDTPVIANPIYREIIARHLTCQQLAIDKPEWQWEKPDGSLDKDRMLQEFQSFWRENSELWESKSKSGYHEAFPHLLLKGLIQVRNYRDKFSPSLLGRAGVGLTPAYLIIFDRRQESTSKSWDERISWEIDEDVTVLEC